METLLSPSTLLSPLRGLQEEAGEPRRVGVVVVVVSRQVRRLLRAQEAAAAAAGGRRLARRRRPRWRRRELGDVLAARPGRRRRCRWQSAWRRRPRRPWRRRFDVLNGGPPEDTYVVDDAGVLSRVTKSDVKRLVRDLESRKNIRINFITVRKLTVRTPSHRITSRRRQATARL
ncbi:hypothetical protein OsI_19901 [Oryza sativa Indica Group]|uniref:TPM domain-containing protein n=1 Tax=Oryza sativa subsp. indica TaxID=39946 RepID=B8AY25_ORYSI|nr:hypothetical protein OsI_19901 [Oryza sativa Indica Group]